MTFEYKLPIRRSRTLPPFPIEDLHEPGARPARLARLLVLGHKLDSMVESGQVTDYRELAHQAHLSPARIGQIVLLAKLAPEIQEYILFLSAEHSGLITEPQLREVARQLWWDRQRVLFTKLVSRHC